MKIFTSDRSLVWGELDIPLLGLPRDWYGDVVSPAPTFCLACDSDSLWFVASHRSPAMIHPQARPGIFQQDLWKYDVAELFLADPVSGRYLEFNLAPNGAWWNCEFTAPLLRDSPEDFPMPNVETFADLAPDGSWLVAMKLSLELLRARVNFGPATHGNVSFILQSPAQVFLTASDLGPGEPAFHQPARFPKIEFLPMPDLTGHELV